jgi:hypothetical protein
MSGTTMSSTTMSSRAASIRWTLIVTMAIARLGLAAPAFAASYGGFSNDTGNMRPSYYDKSGWHVGLPPAARAAEQQQSARPGRGLRPVQNDWFWDGSGY